MTEKIISEIRDVRIQFIQQSNMEWETVFLYVLPVVLLIWLYASNKYSYWKRQGVHGPMPIFPFGYWPERLISEPIEFELKMHKRYGNLYGLYTGFQPTLTISDPELIKQVMIKDFHLFVNRRDFNILDKQWKTNLFMNSSEDWKRIRSITTPAFTSGKLKKMFPLLKTATGKLLNYLEQISQNDFNTVNIKEVIAGFTIDVIASTSFGTDTDSNGDRSKFNPFLYHGQNMFGKQSVTRILCSMTMPRWFLQVFNITHIFPHDAFKFFVDVTKTMIDRGGDRDDLIKLLKTANVSEDELKNMNYNKLTATSENEKIENNEKTSAGKTKFLSQDEIIGQSIVFFLAGFETAASAITCCLFELAVHPEIQEKLFSEVTSKLDGIDEGNLENYYEAICEIKYLEYCFKETLRKYPPAPRLERRLDADNYTLGGVQLVRDTLIEVSVVAVHYDEKNYPNPTEFDPDRFLPENKTNINPYAFLPFGTGPRNCVGMRFAYQESKICLASLIKKFVFKMCSTTPERIHFPKGTGDVFASSLDLSVVLRN